MKKLILFFAVAVVGATLAGCKEKTWCVTSDFRIVNQTGSDIAVELNDGDKQEIMIISGDTQLVHTKVQCFQSGPEPSMVPEQLDAEMRIGGMIVPTSIWKTELWWNDDYTDRHHVYTLIVTDELLENLPFD